MILEKSSSSNSKAKHCAPIELRVFSTSFHFPNIHPSIFKIIELFILVADYYVCDYNYDVSVKYLFYLWINKKSVLLWYLRSVKLFTLTVTAHRVLLFIRWIISSVAFAVPGMNSRHVSLLQFRIIQLKIWLLLVLLLNCFPDWMQFFHARCDFESHMSTTIIRMTNSIHICNVCFRTYVHSYFHIFHCNFMTHLARQYYFVYTWASYFRHCLIWDWVCCVFLTESFSNSIQVCALFELIMYFANAFLTWNIFIHLSFPVTNGNVFHSASSKINWMPG